MAFVDTGVVAQWQHPEDASDRNYIGGWDDDDDSEYIPRRSMLSANEAIAREFMAPYLSQHQQLNKIPRHAIAICWHFDPPYKRTEQLVILERLVETIYAHLTGSIFQQTGPVLLVTFHPSAAPERDRARQAFIDRVNAIRHAEVIVCDEVGDEARPVYTKTGAAVQALSRHNPPIDFYIFGNEYPHHEMFDQLGGWPPTVPYIWLETNARDFSTMDDTRPVYMLGPHTSDLGLFLDPLIAHPDLSFCRDVDAGLHNLVMNGEYIVTFDRDSFEIAEHLFRTLDPNPIPDQWGLIMCHKHGALSVFYAYDDNGTEFDYVLSREQQLHLIAGSSIFVGCKSFDQFSMAVSQHKIPVLGLVKYDGSQIQPCLGNKLVSSVMLTVYGRQLPGLDLDILRMLPNLYIDPQRWTTLDLTLVHAVADIFEAFYATGIIEEVFDAAKNIPVLLRNMFDPQDFDVGQWLKTNQVILKRYIGGLLNAMRRGELLRCSPSARFFNNSADRDAYESMYEVLGGGDAEIVDVDELERKAAEEAVLQANGGLEMKVNVNGGDVEMKDVNEMKEEKDVYDPMRLKRKRGAVIPLEPPRPPINVERRIPQPYEVITPDGKRIRLRPQTEIYPITAEPERAYPVYMDTLELPRQCVLL